MGKVWENVWGECGKVCWDVGKGDGVGVEGCGKVCWDVQKIRGDVERGMGGGGKVR